jgi:hypothetical protein
MPLSADSTDSSGSSALDGLALAVTLPKDTFERATDRITMAYSLALNSQAVGAPNGK